MIHKQTILRLLVFPAILIGVVQAAFALLSLVLFRDAVVNGFALPAAGILILATISILLLPPLNITALSPHDAMLFAVATWVVMGLLGALPIWLIVDLSFTDSVFESISGLTTTGATVLSGLDSLPSTFLLYRQFLQWLGGLGVVIFVVAILPLLNVGGMTLLKAEMPGPVKDEKVAPRTIRSAHYLWLVYLALTLACGLAYYVAGMGLFDAIAHSFTTVSTGGFSTHDASMGHFDSLSVMWVSNLFMLLGALSFALHYKVFRGLRWRGYWHDEETRIFLSVVMLLSVLVVFGLYLSGQYADAWVTVSQAVFHLISFMTSTGYGAGNYTEWPGFLAILLVVAAYQGGCAGSTAGGSKIVRSTIAVKLIGYEIKRLVYPNGVFTVKYQGKPVEPAVISSVIAFLSINAFLSLLLSALLMATGLDFYSAFTAVAACINVLGPAFGKLGSNFQPVSDAGVWILNFAMIVGRLEFFTVLVLLTPAFWKH